MWRLLRSASLVGVKVRGRRMVAATAVQALARELTAPAAGSDVPPLTLDDPLFRLAGKFRSTRPGPGSSDKRRHLEEGV